MKNVLEWLEVSESAYPDKAVYIEDSKEITFHDVLCTSQKIGTALSAPFLLVKLQWNKISACNIAAVRTFAWHSDSLYNGL